MHWDKQLSNETTVVTWIFVMSLILIAAQQLAWKLTGIPETRIGQPALMFAVGALSFLVTLQSDKVVHPARFLLYAIAFVAFARVAIEIPIILEFGPREWDFLAFYLDGNVAANGLNLYDPHSYQIMSQELGLDVSDGFRREVIDVGTKYPPPTTLLFFPLSLGTIHQAHVVWMLSAAALLVILCFLISLLFRFHGTSSVSLLFRLDCVAMAVLLVVSLPFRGSGLAHGQTTGLLSVFLVLTMLYSGTRVSGVTACLAVLVKPFAIIPAAVLLFSRHWMAVIAGVATGIGLLVLSILVLGTDDWTSYLSFEFATSSPASLYYEVGNKSLLAVIMRALQFTDNPWGNLRVVVLYAGFASVIAALGILLAARIAKRDFRSSYSLLLVTVLLIYPGTIYTYTIILSVPLAIEFWNQVKNRESLYVILLFVLTACLLLQLNLFVANLFLWAFLLRRAQRCHEE